MRFIDSCCDDGECNKLWRTSGSSSEDCDFDQDHLWHLGDGSGYLYLQYFERSVPYGRVPLKDKVRLIFSVFFLPVTVDKNLSLA